jgi:hypothetical protein
MNKEKTFEISCNYKFREVFHGSLILNQLCKQVDLYFGKNKYFANYFLAKEDEKSGIILSMNVTGTK